MNWTYRQIAPVKPEGTRIKLAHAVLPNGQIKAVFERKEAAEAYIWHMNQTKVNERKRA